RQALPELARAESVDSGKPLAVATDVDIPRAILNFEFFADAATQLSSECHPTDGHALNYTLRHPLGVVGTISPCNLPPYLPTWPPGMSRPLWRWAAPSSPSRQRWPRSRRTGSGGSPSRRGSPPAS